MIMPPSSSSSAAANQAIIMAENPNPNNNNLHPLQCPRCNSSNTKFCYYNNYSLSQPRHFCKACKRYWTRGGTLRNVPVGGGCRKNKRIKRPPPPPPSSSAAANPKTDLQSQPTPNHNNNNNPLFYGLNPLEPINFPFTSFSSSTRVCDNNNNNNNNNSAGFDFQPQMNGLGLGFSSGLMMPSEGSGSFYGSLLASSFQNQKLGSGLVPYEEMQMGKDVVKEEGDQNRLGWSPGPNPNPNLIEQIHYPDPSSLIWNMGGSTNIGSWFDPSNSNMGSSVPSLI